MTERSPLADVLELARLERRGWWRRLEALDTAGVLVAADLDPVAELLERVTAGGAWPPRSEASIWRSVRHWRAFADNDRKALARIAKWDSRKGRYRIDALGDRIREGWADHLFGEELEVTPANELDQDLIDDLLEPNDLTEECHAAESEIVVPEGEAWWRIRRDPDVADVPLVDFHSRLDVAPLFLGGRLVAVALIVELGRNEDRPASTRYRHFEIHADGVVEHVLFRGTKSRLGATVPLDEHVELQDLARTLEGNDQADTEAAEGRGWVWEHGLPMLMGRVVGKRGRRREIGVSEFRAIEDQLLDLNEAASIAARNVKLTARKRAVVPAGAATPGAQGPGVDMDLVDDGEGGMVRADGQPLNSPWYDLQDDVLIADPVNEELGRDANPPYKILEYSFDAEPLIAHKRDLVETALTRVGMMPEWVGVRGGDGSSGLATSGTELRLRLLPTDKRGRGKRKAWARELKLILSRLVALSALDEGAGGSGFEWAKTDPPSIKWPAALPGDPVEDATVESTLVGAGLRSVETSIRRQNPKWDDDQVSDELAKIRGDRQASRSLPIA